jgi:hypothetical protein
MIFFFAKKKKTNGCVIVIAILPLRRGILNILKADVTELTVCSIMAMEMMKSCMTLLE